MSPTVSYTALEKSPVGVVWAAGSPAGLVAVHIGGSEEDFVAQVADLVGSEPVRNPDVLTPVLAQLHEYLQGERKTFDLPMDRSVMSDFQQEALDLVIAIPYGQTRTYGEIAHELGRPGAARAVGRANATNPMPLVIPCHRVLGRDGKLHGYGGGKGLETKAWLLSLEGARLL